MSKYVGFVYGEGSALYCSTNDDETYDVINGGWSFDRNGMEVDADKPEKIPNLIKVLDDMQGFGFNYGSATAAIEKAYALGWRAKRIYREVKPEPNEEEQDIF